MIDRAKAQLVAKGYSQVEGVDYFETFAPTASTTSNRLIAAMACKLDWDLRRLDVDQALIGRVGCRDFLETSSRLWRDVG